MDEVVFENNPFKNIFYFSKNPPDLFDFSTDDATFKNVDIKECIVHVPKGRIDIYKEAKGWSYFNSIIDDSQDFLNNFESKNNSENSHWDTYKLLNLTKYLNL